MNTTVCLTFFVINNMFCSFLCILEKCPSSGVLSLDLVILRYEIFGYKFTISNTYYRSSDTNFAVVTNITKSLRSKGYSCKINLLFFCHINLRLLGKRINFILSKEASSDSTRFTIIMLHPSPLFTLLLSSNG